MAERKPGPVKPPVIDLKARETRSGEDDAQRAESPRAARGASRKARGARSAPTSAPGPDVEAATKASAPDTGSQRAEMPQPEPQPDGQPHPQAGAPSEPPTPPPPPRPPARLAMPWSAISIAALAGGLFGVGLTYIAANWIALPTESPAFADPAPALTALTESASATEARLDSVEAQARRTQVSLDATLTQFDRSFEELRTEIEAIRAATPQTPVLDLDALDARFAALDARIAGLAAGVSPAEAGTLAESLADIDASLGALGERLEAIEARADVADGALAGLETGLSEVRVALADQARRLAGAQIAPAARLPLVVSGLESAFATGRPYSAELQSLSGLLPDIVVPTPVAAGAENGLMRPEAIVAAFETAVPAVLAGQAGISSGDWAEDAAAWARSILALRPAEELDGDHPEAIVSRLEAAISRRDFTTATAMVTALPDPMRAPLSDIEGEIAAHAAAEQFVLELRARALDPALVPEVGS